MEHKSIHKRVRRQFGAAAINYVSSASHQKGDDLNLLVNSAGDVSGKKVLDIATGGGHTAIALAKRGAIVTAADLTPEIIVAARDYAESQGVSMEYSVCPAEALPFSAESFEVVSCRIAPHHFADAEMFVAETFRVLKRTYAW